MTLPSEGSVPLTAPLATPRNMGTVNVSPVVDPLPLEGNRYCLDCGKLLHRPRYKRCALCRARRDRELRQAQRERYRHKQYPK